MIDLIVGGIIVLILSFSISRIVIAKKKGIRCIGCDAGAHCAKQQTTGCRCGSYDAAQISCEACKGCQGK